MSRFLATVLGAALLSGLGAQVATAQICWIHEVRKSADGVVIVFDGGRGVTLNPASDEPVTTQLSEDGLLSAKLGDSVLSANNPEDSCMMDVAMVDGRIGVKASAAFHPPPLHLPGVPDVLLGGVTEQFIPAR